MTVAAGRLPITPLPSSIREGFYCVVVVSVFLSPVYGSCAKAAEDRPVWGAMQSKQRRPGGWIFCGLVS